MGHYDDQYISEKIRREKQRKEDVLRMYYLAKENIDNLRKEVSPIMPYTSGSVNSKTNHLGMAFDKFNDHLNLWLIEEDILKIDDQILVDKLTKE